MRLPTRAGGAAQETPEQTLARLNAASRGTGGSASYQPFLARSMKVRLQGYYKTKIDQLRADYEARLSADMPAPAPAPAPAPERTRATSIEGSDSPAHRLARIPQRRWQLICALFWVCIVSLFIVVHWAVSQFSPESTPDDASAAALSVAAVLIIAFSTLGAVRTNHINPDDRTTLQRALKYCYEHLGDGGL